MSKPVTCVLCKRRLPQTANGDPKAATARHCSPYEWDMDLATGKPGAPRSYTLADRSAHERWLRTAEAQRLLKAERTAMRVHGEIADAKLDAFAGDGAC